MMRILFRGFGCLTVFVFFTGFIVYLLATSNPPISTVDRDIRAQVYPAALNMVRENFSKMGGEFMSGVPRKSITITDLEANAFLDSWLSSPSRKITNNAFVTFRKGDTVRFRFDISMDNVKSAAVSRIKGNSFETTLVNLMRAGKITRTLVVTVDFGVEWNEDHPFIYLRNAYLGMLPLPGVGFVNEFVLSLNKDLAATLENSNKKSFFIVKNIKMRDKMMTIDFQAKITEEWLRHSQITNFQKENPDLFRPKWQGCPPEGCDPKTAERMQEFMFKLSGKDIHQINKNDADQIRQILQGVK